MYLISLGFKKIKKIFITKKLKVNSDIMNYA